MNIDVILEGLGGYMRKSYRDEWYQQNTGGFLAEFAGGYSLEHILFESLLTKTSMAQVAGIEDGEDSAGRAKIRLQTPSELVQRCAEIAAIAVAESRARGWVREMTLAEREEKIHQYAEEQAANEAK